MKLLVWDQRHLHEIWCFLKLICVLNKSNLGKIKDDWKGQWYGVGYQGKSFIKRCSVLLLTLWRFSLLTTIFQWLSLHSAHPHNPPVSICVRSFSTTGRLACRLYPFLQRKCSISPYHLGYHLEPVYSSKPSQITCGK